MFSVTKAPKQRNSITARIGSLEGRRVKLHGRDAWALLQLVVAGLTGVTPVERPAPRWSAYIHNLREAGFSISTIREPHTGEYPGYHGRYVLNDVVFIEGDADFEMPSAVG
jgi:hypothetical protein